MALFKISKGQSKNLPKTYNEGYAYFTTDDGKFYIDTNNTSTGRIGLNAFKADQDRQGNIIDETYITAEDTEIITGPAPKIDAETLGGIDASEYALKTNLNDYALKTNLNDYALKTELNTYNTEMTNNIKKQVSADLDDVSETGTVIMTNADLLAGMTYRQIMDSIYPIGRVIMTFVSEDPNMSYPWQTWERTANGRFLLGADDSYAVGSMGGEASITLEEKHVPPHNHTISRGADKATGTTWESYAPGSGQTATGTHLINSTSRSAASAFSIMPPYLAVNMWKRTA